MLAPTRDSIQKAYLEKQGKLELKAESSTRSFQQAVQAASSGDHEAVVAIYGILGRHFKTPDTHRGIGWLQDIFPYAVPSITYDTDYFVTQSRQTIYIATAGQWILEINYTYTADYFIDVVTYNLLFKLDVGGAETIFKTYEYTVNYNSDMFVTDIEKVEVLNTPIEDLNF